MLESFDVLSSSPMLLLVVVFINESRFVELSRRIDEVDGEVTTDDNVDDVSVILLDDDAELGDVGRVVDVVVAVACCVVVVDLVDVVVGVVPVVVVVVSVMLVDNGAVVVEVVSGVVVLVVAGAVVVGVVVV